MSILIELLKHPVEDDWLEVKRRAMVTVGKQEFKPPTEAWRRKILEARHSPIRYLTFSFRISGLPYCTSVHLVRHHVGIEKYVRSQRNDRQDNYDRRAARQDAPVDMIIDINAEALMVLANKRLCSQAEAETRAVVYKMCQLVQDVCSEFEGLLVPMCWWQGGVCHEMKCCGYNESYKDRRVDFGC